MVTSVLSFALRCFCLCTFNFVAFVTVHLTEPQVQLCRHEVVLELQVLLLIIPEKCYHPRPLVPPPPSVFSAHFVELQNLRFGPEGQSTSLPRTPCTTRGGGMSVEGLACSVEVGGISLGGGV